MLIFDLRETEKNYFNQNNFEYFEIKFFQESLNEETVKKIPKEDLENALIISVFTTSEITEKVIEKFKNLRIVSTRSTGCEHIDFKPCDFELWTFCFNFKVVTSTGNLNVLSLKTEVFKPININVINV